MTPEPPLTAPVLDPEVHAFNEQVKAAFAKQLAAAQAAADPQQQPSLALTRQVAEQVRAPWTRGGPQMARTEEHLVGGVRVRVHRPALGPLPALVYLHGGGWTFFSIDTHDRLMREYAARSGCVVVAVNYSLAPEAPFPRALDEISEVLRWVQDNAADLQLDTAHWALGGDSAGANLAICTALRERDKGRPTPGGLLLNYGVYDWAAYPSTTAYTGDPYMLDASEMEFFWANYVTTEGRESPYARPLYAELRGLPPSFMCIAEYDVLAGENHAMAARLAEAGVPVTAQVYPGSTHSFLEAVSISRLADQAIQDGADWLRALFSSGPAPA